MNVAPLLQLGPIVGFTDSSSTRIWIRAKERLGLKLRYRASTQKVSFARGSFKPVPVGGELSVASFENWKGGENYQVCSLVLSGLSADTRYFYEVVTDEQHAQHPSEFCSDAPPSFRTLPLAESKNTLAFAFMSCNGVGKAPRRTDPLAMWKRALDVLVGGQQSLFTIFGGDQIYADRVKDTIEREIRREGLAPQKVPARAAELYGDVYLDDWDRPEIRTFMAHMPCLMMWDDHDIYDGWGSHGNESEPLQQELFTQARIAFELHQQPHNPPSLNGASHKAFGVALGSRLIFVTDGRSCRRSPPPHLAHLESNVLGDEQWVDFKRWLGQTSTASHVVVITGVPLVFMPPPTGALRTIGGVFSLADDLGDQWSSPNNRREQLRILGTLFEHRARLGANILTIGGDVHVAALGVVESTDPRYVRPGESTAQIHQLVASGIAHEPARNVMYVRVSDETQTLAERIRARFSQVHHTRNFALIELKSDHSRFVMNVFLEGGGTVTQDCPLL
ncbi:MAG TPA: alkaline phosphatase D family protein [Polyangiales bacterium]